MPRTFYTIEDLASFCKQNNFARFNSKEHGNKPLIVQSVETFEVSDNSKDGLMPVSLKSCHIGVNRNQSCISEEVMKADMSSFKGRPILANIIKTDTGEYEFHSHDITFNEDGEMEYWKESAVDFYVYINGEVVLAYDYDNYETDIIGLAYTNPNNSFEGFYNQAFGVDYSIDNFVIGSSDFAWTDRCYVGDVDGDNYLTSNDALCMRKLLAKVVDGSDFAQD